MEADVSLTRRVSPKPIWMGTDGSLRPDPEPLLHLLLPTRRVRRLTPYPDKPHQDNADIRRMIAQSQPWRELVAETQYVGVGCVAWARQLPTTAVAATSPPPSTPFGLTASAATRTIIAVGHHSPSPPPHQVRPSGRQVRRQL